MTAQRVASLYDALHAFEMHRRGERAYPVHKRLREDHLGMDDIYDWVIERVRGRGVRRALDAGCGVGYGSLRLAERLGCAVTGISLSEREVSTASAAAAALGVERRVEFERASFDELPSATYDLIVAVESLKHSGDVALSVRSMLAALVPGGMLVIVDDCYDGRATFRGERQLVGDWELARLYSERDFTLPLSGMPHEVVDLSAGVRRSGRISIALRLLGVELVRPFVRERVKRALHAFRGGLRLEQLYAMGAMSYKAIVAEARIAPGTAQPSVRRAQ